MKRLFVSNITVNFTHLQEENRIKGSNRVGGRSLTIGGPSNYLPYAPSELLQMGYYKKHVNVIAGVVKNEGSFLTAREFNEMMDRSIFFLLLKLSHVSIIFLFFLNF